jgi:hypothetical protein
LSHLTPREALAFFDPSLAACPAGPDLVRSLLDETHRVSIRIDGTDESLILSRLNYHRLLPQLRLLRHQLEVSEEFGRSLDRAGAELAMQALRLERLLITVGRLFESKGVESLVLKGGATSRLDHDDPGSRQAVDVDVLVRRRDLPVAQSALLEAEFRPPLATSTLMDKGGSWTDPLGDSIDLHTRLHTVGRPMTETWWASSESFQIAGQTFRALNRPGRMAHAASHFALSYPNHRILSSLLDLTVISRGATPAERSAAERLLEEVGVTDIVYRITRRAAVLVGDDAVVLGASRRGLRNALIRRAYDRPDFDPVSVKLAKTYGMPWRDRMRVIRNWTSPTEEFLALGGYTSRADRIRQVLSRSRVR